MTDLSISKAWEEAKAVVARDGRIFGSVALALVALPAAVSGLVAPGGLLTRSPAPPWVALVLFIGFVITLAGQLALVRLAIGPSITVAEAIAHGLRRMPVYLVAVLLICLALFAAAIPLAAALAAAGVQFEGNSVPMTPAIALTACLFLAVAIFIFVRMLMSVPATTAEPIGPVEILKRTWQLTSGNWWPLFGFFLVYIIAQIVLQIAVGATVGVAVVLLLGKPEPLSVSALLLSLAQAALTAALVTLFAVMLARIYVQLSGRGAASVPKSGT